MQEKEKTSFNFIDLFSGIGGFHMAAKGVAKKINAIPKLLVAADIDPETRKLYKLNYNETPINDVRDIEEIEKKVGGQTVDIIFAGFPCQPFSHAGFQKGFQDEEKGNLFFDLMHVVDKFKPKYLLFENVYNLKNHDKGNTWFIIKEKIRDMGYIVPKDPIVISPHLIGKPEIRKRVYIPCIRGDIFPNGKEPEISESFIDFLNSFDKKHKISNTAAFNKTHKLNSGRDLDEEKKRYLNVWEHFLRQVDFMVPKPSWSMYWNDNINIKEIERMPKWKQSLVNKNIEFYEKNKEVIRRWFIEYPEILSWSNSFRKFEWNAGPDIKGLDGTIIQFRPSGIRAKRPNTFPTFVAMNHTPIIGETMKYISSKDILRLQGFGDFDINGCDEKSVYRMVGNTVNVYSTSVVLERLLMFEEYWNGETNE